MISILLVFSLLAVSKAEGASPTELIDWSTGWGGLDPSEQSKVKKMVEDAKHREEMAHKELLEAQRDEERAEQTQKKLPEGQAPAVTPVHSQVLRLPSSSKVAAAKRFAEEQATLARSAEQAAQKHLERAEMAAQHVKKAPDVRSKDQAEQQAKAEAGLATEAEHNATVKKLEAKIAQDKVRLMEMSLRGSQGETYPWLEYALVGTGLFMLSLCAFLVFGRASAKMEPLQEPLLGDPMWNEEGSAEEWKQRAMAALDLSNKSKAMAAEFKAEAEAKESRHAEQMGALEAKMKADSEVARSELLEKCTALEAKAEDSQRALQAKGEEAEKAQKELDALKSTIQADSGAAEAVQQEERLAQAHAELATLHERLRLAQESLDRSKEESRSAQAAAEEAQNLHRQALSKVDLNAEVEKARADEKEGSLKLMEQEHESKVKEVSELTSQIQLGRQKTGEMEEELSKAQQRVQELQGEAEAASKAREMTAKEKAEVEQKLVVANEEKLEIEKQLIATKEEHSKAKGEAQRMAAELQVHLDSLEKQGKKAEEIQSSLDEHKLQLRQAQTDADQAKQAVQDSSQAMEAVRQQAAVEIAQHKKAVEDLQGDLKKHAATLESHQLEAENEKMRADLAESIAKSRQEELEAAQRLAEKSKAALQSVRQELTAECSAAKAQVEVERKLALEAEEMAEKFRLETQAARSAEQQARISEQEAKAVINKLKQSAAGCDDTALVEMRKQLASAQGEAEKAKNDLRSLREAKATEASEATEIPGTVA